MSLWICHDCGKKYGKPVGGVHTWHENKCDYCLNVKAVTSARHFGWPELPDRIVVYKGTECGFTVAMPLPTQERSYMKTDNDRVITVLACMLMVSFLTALLWSNIAASICFAAIVLSVERNRRLHE